MSFISIVAREAFITIVTDGLVKNMEIGQEVDQHYKKFKKLVITNLLFLQVIRV